MKFNADTLVVRPRAHDGSAVRDSSDVPELPPRKTGTQPGGTPSAPRAGRLLVVVVVLLAGGFAAGLIPRLRERAVVRAETRALAVPTVKVTTPAPAKAGPPITLSGELKPLTDAAIHARTSGYVHRWLVDLGAHVESGQILAEIDTPEIDRQLAQARAELTQSQAAMALAEATAKRWAQMLASRTVSPQEAEEKQSDFTYKQATVEAAKANVERLEDVAGFARITAPFAGTITARRLDVGQLVNAGAGEELFRLAQTDKLRVFVRVPQSYARSVTPGQTAELTVPEIPGRTFEAKVVRTAGALEAASRTLLVELEVDNTKGEILAGSYAQVRLPDAKPEPVLTLPANTLLFRPEGPLVAMVGADQHIAMRRVTLGRDFGTSIQVLAGVTAADRVVLNPPDSLQDGAEVRAVEFAQ